MIRRIKVVTVASLIISCLVLMGMASKTEKSSKEKSSKIEVTEKLLAKIAKYEEGQSRKNLIKLTYVVRKSHGSPQQLKQLEKQFLKFLNSDATPDAKNFICRQLTVIGSEDSVPTLAALLTQPQNSEMSLYALERIPGEAVDKALLSAIDKTSGKTKLGIIHSLGRRRSDAAARTLGRMLKSKNDDVVKACAFALGKIGSRNAASAIRSAFNRSSDHRRRVFADAYLTCAYNLAASGNKSTAADAYREMYNTAEPSTVRSAALIGLVDADPNDALRLILQAITSNDSVTQPVAISLIKNVHGTKATEALAAELPNISTDGQIQLLSALADRKDPAALPAVTATAKANSEIVRIAAIEALACLGDSSTAIMLARTAATTKGLERHTARESLCSLKGKDINQKIVAEIFMADPKMKVELIRSIGCRNITDAVQNLLETARDKDSDVRIESIRVLKNLAEPSHLRELIEILTNAKSELELKDAGKTVSAVARKGGGKGTDTIIKALNSAKDVKIRCVFLEILGDIADAHSLSSLRTALKDSNEDIKTAAVRAMVNWPNAEPSADLLEIAKTSDDPTRRTLALRGHIRLITLESAKSPAEKVGMFRKAMTLAGNNDDRKMILAALTEAKSLESLQMAVEYMDNRDLNQEAAAAVIKIAEDTLKTDPGKTKAALELALATARISSLQQRAQELLNQIK